MKPCIVSVCIVDNNSYFGRLLHKCLSKREDFFVYRCTFDKISNNRDIYIFLTDNEEDMEQVPHLGGYKVAITESLNYKPFLDKGVKTIYDSTINVSELYNLGLHLYIYQRDLHKKEITSLLKIIHDEYEDPNYRLNDGMLSP